MKKRILFVDDEPLVLAGLRRMLHGMRKQWEMVFVESGDAALGFMADNAVDVVVSDMRMPGMNGAQLLNEVMKRYPRTVRLILSGHADQDLILKCVGSTHQYLSKPCDPDALRATVSRAIGLEASLKNECLQRLIGQMDSTAMVPTRSSSPTCRCPA
jgi:DNA-binding NarL/FixJ family response regulator